MDLVRGAVAGAAAGIFASWVMEEFQAAWTRRLGPPPGGGESATVRTADRAARAALDRPLREGEKEAAAEAVHYATGSAVGAVYGGLSELVPDLRLGAGSLYGAAVWIGADELAVPALRLGKHPLETPPPTHLYALASHLVFGVSLELARRVLRAVL